VSSGEQASLNVTADYENVAASVQEYLDRNSEKDVGCIGIVYTSWPENNLSRIAPYAAKIRSFAINAKLPYSWDLSLLSEFKALERLVLVEAQEVDLGAVPRLKSYRGPWSARCHLEACVNIEDLCLEKFAPATGDMQSLAMLRDLRDLELRSTSITSFVGMDFDKLHNLGVFRAPKLASLNGILGAPSLRRLMLSGCKRLHEFEALAGLKSLETLVLTGGLTIRSVDFVASMHQLAEFRVVDSMIQDGNTLPLLTVPNLYFNDKKSYSHTLNQIRELQAQVK